MGIAAIISAQTRLKWKHTWLVKRNVVPYALGAIVRAEAEFKSIPSCLQHEEQESFFGDIFSVEDITELMKLFQVVNKCSKHFSVYLNLDWNILKSRLINRYLVFWFLFSLIWKFLIVFPYGNWLKKLYGTATNCDNEINKHYRLVHYINPEVM